MAAGLSKAAAANSASELENLRDQITCSICFTVFEDPKILPCHHTYCRQCLSDMARSAQRTPARASSVRITCPACRKDVKLPGSSVDDLQSSFMINQLKEIVERMERGMIEANDKIPTPSAPPPDHVVPMTSSSTQCRMHPSQLSDLYCRTCQVLLCRYCITMDTAHQSHDYGLVENVANDLRHTISQNLEPLHHKARELSGVLGEVSNYEGLVEAQGTEICYRVAQWSDHLIRKIQEVAEGARVEIQVITEAKLACLAAQKSQLSGIGEEIDSLIGWVEQSAGVVSDEEFLSSRGRLEGDIQRLLRQASALSLHPMEGPGIATHLLDPDSIADTFRKQCSIVSLSDPAGCKIVEEGVDLEHLEVGEVKIVVLKVAAHLLLGDKVEATFQSKHGSVAVELKPLSACMVEASFQPALHTRGSCSLSVKVNGVHISNSPLGVSVAPPPPPLLGRIISQIREVPRPIGLAFTPAGRLLVASEAGLLVYDGSFVRQSSIKSPPSLAKLWSPWELAVDDDGIIYVTDSKNKALHKFSSDGCYLKSLSAHKVGALFFNGVGVRNKNTLYVCDSAQHRVFVLNTDLELLKTIGSKGCGVGEFDVPDNVAFDDSENAYVTDFNNSRVQVITQYGKCLAARGTMQGQLVNPNDICIYRDIAYVTDYASKCVVMFDIHSRNLKMRFLHQFGREELSCPEGVVVDSDGYAYVADSGNDRIVVF